MDLLSLLPDTILHQTTSFLSITDIARLSGVSRLFKSHSLNYFSSLCSSYHCESQSPILDYGHMYSQKLLIIDSWDKDSQKTLFPHNLVKSVKFGTDFISILKYDGTLYSNIEKGDMKLIEIQVKDIDSCMNGLIVWKYNNEITWQKFSNQSLNKIICNCKEISVIAASAFGVVGTRDGKVVAFDEEYQREVVFQGGNAIGIKDIKATPKMLLILLENNLLFSCGLITFEALFINYYDIRSIGIGTSHSLALAQASVEQLSNWSTETLLKFMSDNGFEDCCQLIHNHEINGKELADMDEKYFVETLGIRETDRRNKLRYLLKQSNSQKFAKKFEILGWGRNNFMQLGPEGFQHTSPIKLITPELKENEIILSLHGDKHYSYILTSHHRVLALGGKSANKVSKADKKLIGWEEIQSKLIENAKVVRIETCQNIIGVIYRQESKSKTKIKMRMAEDILRMISNGKIPLDSYEIGYLDRFLGIMEITLKDFSKTDIPKHRIQYFKRNSKIVWDRRTRLDIF